MGVDAAVDGDRSPLHVPEDSLDRRVGWRAIGIAVHAPGDLGFRSVCELQDRSAHDVVPTAVANDHEHRVVEKLAQGLK